MPDAEYARERIPQHVSMPSPLDTDGKAGLVLPAGTGRSSRNSPGNQKLVRHHQLYELDRQREPALKRDGPVTEDWKISPSVYAIDGCTIMEQGLCLGLISIARSRLYLYGLLRSPPWDLPRISPRFKIDGGINDAPHQARYGSAAEERWSSLDLCSAVYGRGNWVRTQGRAITTIVVSEMLGMYLEVKLKTDSEFWNKRTVLLKWVADEPAVETHRRKRAYSPHGRRK
ncbi:hypothetical protein B0H19DRAFT_1061211 [Mycena capillaripes]|nr:hypothetical protein B0H19DRAFT_1061211 [Mycena capillaripes]